MNEVKVLEGEMIYLVYQAAIARPQPFDVRFRVLDNSGVEISNGLMTHLGDNLYLDNSVLMPNHDIIIHMYMEDSGVIINSGVFSEPSITVFRLTENIWDIQTSALNVPGSVGEFVVNNIPLDGRYFANVELEGYLED